MQPVNNFVDLANYRNGHVSGKINKHKKLFFALNNTVNSLIFSNNLFHQFGSKKPFPLLSLTFGEHIKAAASIVYGKINSSPFNSINMMSPCKL